MLTRLHLRLSPSESSQLLHSLGFPTSPTVLFFHTTRHTNAVPSTVIRVIKEKDSMQEPTNFHYPTSVFDPLKVTASDSLAFSPFCLGHHSVYIYTSTVQAKTAHTLKFCFTPYGPKDILTALITFIERPFVILGPMRLLFYISLCAHYSAHHPYSSYGRHTILPLHTINAYTSGKPMTRAPSPPSPLIRLFD